MTVDMLAATFFWPEGMVLGSQNHPDEPLGEPRAVPPAEPEPSAPAPDLWAGLKRFVEGVLQMRKAARQG